MKDMRYFAARDRAPADYCRARVRECHVYVAVIGFRYGSTVPGETVSYTEPSLQRGKRQARAALLRLLHNHADEAPAAELPGWVVKLATTPEDKNQARALEGRLGRRGPLARSWPCRCRWRFRQSRRPVTGQSDCAVGRCEPAHGA